MSGPTTGVVRIGNCSGFYGDRLSAMREMLEGATADGHGLDYLTGDYLAELTMLILGKDTMKDPSLGYARTFVRQAEDCLGLALERGVKIVANAGGLNPAGLAGKLREVAAALGVDAVIAHVEGDDLRPRAAELGLTDALTANAYLGGFGIAAALAGGADVVVTGRVTDASLVVGPAAFHHGWTAEQHDELASAVVAGHVIECGTQATGGNYSGFLELRQNVGDYRDLPLGFPLVELAADGSFVVTKQADTGGAVTVDTVTAQLVYEIQSTRYLNPDVTTHLDTVELAQVGPDRVAVTGVRGEAPPQRLKVCVNELGGWRNSMEILLTGLEIDAKEEWVKSQLTAAWGDRAPATVAWSRSAPPVADPASQELASCVLRVTALDPDPKVAGKGFTAPAVEVALGSFPGFTLMAPPGPATPYGIYRPEHVDRSVVEHTVVHADGRREVVADPTTFLSDDALAAVRDAGRRPSRYDAPADQVTRKVPLGTFVHARSGDKGGNANLGLWVAHGVSTGSTGENSPTGENGSTGESELYAARVEWLTKLITPEKVRELVPEAEGLEVDVFVLPHLGAVNVVIHGLLGAGVAAGTRVDPQAKALGEWVRSRHVNVRGELL